MSASTILILTIPLQNATHTNNANPLNAVDKARGLIFGVLRRHIWFLFVQIAGRGGKKETV